MNLLISTEQQLCQSEIMSPPVTKKGMKAGVPTQSQTVGKSGQGGGSAGAVQAAVTFAQSIPSLGSFWLRDIWTADGLCFEQP